MTNYTGSLNISGSIEAAGVSANASANLGVVLSATINSAGNGSGSETFNGNLTVSYTYGGSGTETVPFDLPLTNVQIQSGSFRVSEPVKEFDGINFGVTLNGTVSANQSQISESFMATASGTYQGISFYATLSGSALLLAAAPPISPETISGTAADQTTSDTAALTPMRDVIVTDPNPGQTDTVSVTLSNAANGELSTSAGGNYNPATGVYTDTGTAAAVTAAVDSLVFTPTVNQAAAGQTVTTGFTINVSDTDGQTASNTTTSVVTTETLLGSLSIGQQLELIYIAYFNRAADAGGFTFWQQQYHQFQASGEPTATVVTNIANAFAPQTETEALYPSLDPYVGTTNPPPLNTPAGQTALSTFIGSVYTNLFDRAPDPVGEAYWVGQIATGAVEIGAAALAIANGATGADLTGLQNRIAAALAATNPSGTTGTELNDAPVTAGEATTTASVFGASMMVTTDAVAGSTTSPASPATGSVDANVITVTGTDQLINPGAGSYTIQFLAGASADTLVLGTSGVDQVSGFNPGTDVLDFSSLLGAANVNLNGDIAALGNYVTIADQGADALVNFDPAGHGGGSTVAVLQGLGSVVTSLDSLVAQGAVRIE